MLTGMKTNMSLPSTRRRETDQVLDIRSDLSFGFEYRTKYPKEFDISSSYAHSTPYGNPLYVTNGTLDTVSLSNLHHVGHLFVPQMDATTFGGRTHTIASLFKYANTFSSVNANFILAKEKYNTNSAEFSLHIIKHNSTQFSVNANYYPSAGGGASNGMVIGGILFSGFDTNIWHYVLLEYDYSTNTANLYLDNVLYDTKTFPSLTVSRSQEMYIGNRHSGTGIEAWINDLSLQYVYKWDRILTENEKQYLWNSGNFRFIS